MQQKTMCPGRELNPGQPNLSVLVTGADRTADASRKRVLHITHYTLHMLKKKNSRGFI